MDNKLSCQSECLSKIFENIRRTHHLEFGHKTLSDANTPKYTEKKNTTKDYVTTIEGKILSFFGRRKVQNKEITRRKRKVVDCNVRFGKSAVRFLSQS